MNFYDIDPMALPAQAQYYFNIFVICVLLDDETMTKCFGPDMESYWSIENITDPRPQAIGFFRLDEEEMAEISEEYGTDVTCSIDCIPHCVVEVDPDLGVSWYPMFDEYERNDPWSI